MLKDIVERIVCTFYKYSLRMLKTNIIEYIVERFVCSKYTNSFPKIHASPSFSHWVEDLKTIVTFKTTPPWILLRIKK